MTKLQCRTASKMITIGEFYVVFVVSGAFFLCFFAEHLIVCLFYIFLFVQFDWTIATLRGNMQIICSLQIYSSNFQ